MTATKNIENQNVSAMLAAETKNAEAIIKDIGAGVVSITARVKDLAEVVVNVRAHIPRSITSKKTQKAVTVMDWDGRSPEYKEWYREVLQKMIEEHIPTEFRGTVRTRLQNQVQERMHKVAPASQKAHLGLSAQSKATTQEAKRQAAKTAPKPSERESQEVLPGDDIVATFESIPLPDACQYLAAIASALAKRTGSAGWSDGLSRADLARCEKLLKQSFQSLMTTRGTVTTAAAPVKVAA